MNIEERINKIIDKVLNEEMSKKISGAVKTISEGETNEYFFDGMDLGDGEKSHFDRGEFDGHKSRVVGVDSDIEDERLEEEVCETCGKEICECGSEMAEEAKPDFLDLDKDGDKEEPMKQAAKDAKNESKKRVVSLSESEMIELIQRLVMEQKEAKGMKETEKTLKASEKVNDEAMKEVNKKMKDYVKAGSNEGYEENPEGFPKGNGEMGEDLSMKYHASDAVEEYIDQIARSGGMENLDYDAIKPDEEWIEMNIMGDSKTGNSQEYANAVKTDANEKVNDRRKKNWLAKLKKDSYNKAVQPVEDVAGRGKSDKAAMSPDEVMSALGENVQEKKTQKINEDIDKIKSMFEYSRRTQ